MFTGIGGKNHDHRVHTFVFSPDGKLYFNMGNEGKQLYYPLKKELPLRGPIDKVEMKPVVDLDGKEVNNHGKPYRMGMAFRCDLDGSDVETLAWNFRNNYELAVDSFGTIWQSDNDDDGNRGVRVNYVMEHGNFGYSDEMTGAAWRAAWEQAQAKGASEDSKVFYEWHQYDPGVVPNLLNTGGGSPTGITVYEGNLLPEVFRNQLIHCDAGPRVVRAYPLRVDGAGYHAEIKDILTTKDTWFRPSDVCTAPDGSICVADWSYVGAALKDEDPDIRITGLRIARALKLDLVPCVNSLVKDASPQLRRECAIALRHSQSTEAPRLWSKLAMQYDAGDRWYLEALGI